MTVHCGNASYIGLWCCDILARSPVVVTLFSDSCVLCEFSRLLTLVSCAYHLVDQWDSRPWLPLSICRKSVRLRRSRPTRHQWLRKDCGCKARQFWRHYIASIIRKGPTSFRYNFPGVPFIFKFVVDNSIKSPTL